MDRRIFLQWAGLGGLASTIPGCFNTDQASPTGPAPGAPAQAEVSMGPVSQLDQAGFLLNEKTPLGPVMVTRDPANPDQVKAVNPTCTHRGCTIGWQASAQGFECRCHGAKFAPDGSVLQGPAQRPLSTYQARIENGAVLVTQGEASS